jgi:hypothetical protein
LINYSKNRFVSLFLSVFLFGCAAGPIKAIAPASRPPKPLEIKSLLPDKASPQVQEMATIRWTASVTGGVGERVYTFWSSGAKGEVAEQKGMSPIWEWSPREAGTYRVKVVVRDSGGNTVDSGWSPEYVVAPLLVLSSLLPDKVSPQAAGMATVRWMAEARGGAGGLSFEFRLLDGKEEKTVQKGSMSTWDWSPMEAGIYRVKVVVRDYVGNTAEGGWSPAYAISPKLVVSSLSPDKISPQSAETATIRWTASVTGGVGERVYTFWSSGAKGEVAEQKGTSPTWEWSPMETGTYRIKVAVRDAIGNEVKSGWSPDYEIGFAAGLKSRIAIMPIENLSGSAAPTKKIREMLTDTLKKQGLDILGENVLADFMAKHRIRYIGGLTNDLGKVFLKETGTNAVLFSSLDLYTEAEFPKIALTLRLVQTGKATIILWMGSVGMTGNDTPGALGLGLTRDSRLLQKKAMEKIVKSLMAYLSGERPRVGQNIAGSSWVLGSPKKRYLPKEFHRSPRMPSVRDKHLTIAVLPFFNESLKRHAGEIMALHFVERLSQLGNIEVIEPGVVWQALLASRMIMEGGLSLPQADLLKALLDVDLVLTGTVTDYQDPIDVFGNPKVEFTARIVDTTIRQMVWSSISFNRGDDGVFFFDVGKVNTAHSIASKMAFAVAFLFMKEPPGK